MAKSNPSIQFDSDPLNGSGPFPTFVPGQTVSGKVTYAVQTQKRIDEVVIILKGKCFTWIKRSNGNNSTVYKEKIVLFRFRETVFRGPYEMQSANFEWPFSFVLPESTNHVRGNPNSALYTDGPQPLPPSVDVQNEGFGSHCKAIISYDLKVKVNPDRLLHSEKVSQRLVVVPYSSSPLPQPVPTRVIFDTQEWTSKQLRPEQHSFKQKMSHVFSNDPSLKTPTIRFGATAHFPRAASIWQPMPISFSIQHRRMGPTDPENPVLVLDSVQLELKAYTNLQVSGTFSNHDSSAKSSLGSHTIRGQHVLLPLDDQPIQVTDNFRLVDLCREWRLTPSFGTYTINQSYTLKLTAYVRHPDTGHVFKLETKTPFEIRPIENPNAGTTAAPVPQIEPSDMPAPTYELATASSPPNYPGPSYQEPSFAGSSYQEPGFEGLSYQDVPYGEPFYQEPHYGGPSYQNDSYQVPPLDDKWNKQALYQT